MVSPNHNRIAGTCWKLQDTYQRQCTIEMSKIPFFYLISALSKSFCYCANQYALPQQSATSTIYYYPSIRMQRLSRDETTILARKENEARCDLRRLARPPHRRGELILRIVVHRAGNQWRPDLQISCQSCVVFADIGQSIDMMRNIPGKKALTGPGHTQFTRMPLLICWLARPRVKATMAPFVLV